MHHNCWTLGRGNGEYMSSLDWRQEPEMHFFCGAYLTFHTLDFILANDHIPTTCLTMAYILRHKLPRNYECPAPLVTQRGIDPSLP